jgi:hypothetical protein
MIDFKPLCPPADPQSSQRQVSIIDHHQQVGQRDLVKRKEITHGPAAQIHERRGLREHHAVTDIRNSCDQGLPLRRFSELDLMTSRKLLGDLETHVVAGFGILRTGIPKADNQLQEPIPNP